MTTLGLQTWIQRRGLLAVGAVFILHLAFLLLLSEKLRPALVPRPSFLPLQVLSDSRDNRALAHLLVAADPGPFVLPDPRGFAGSAWRRVPPADHAEIPWQEPVRWLSAESAWFGLKSLPALAASARFRSTAEKPVAVPSQVPTSPLPISDQSLLELDPRLAELGIAAPVAFPSLTHSNLLGATELKVGIESDGDVFSAVIVRSSGWRVADERAVGLIQGVRFRRRPPSEGEASRTWGWVRVRWRTVAPKVPQTP